MDGFLDFLPQQVVFIIFYINLVDFGPVKVHAHTKHPLLGGAPVIVD